MRRQIPSPVMLFLGPAAAGLLACEPKPQNQPASGPAAVGCSAEEMRSRRARTPACAAQFQALLDKAEADRRRGSAIADPPPAAARDRF